jgi:hypothetical protein
MARLKKLLPVCLALAALAAPGTGMADPWKDESGKGRGNRHERGWDRRGDRWDDRRDRDRDRWERHDRRGGHRGDRWDYRRGYGYHPPPPYYGPPPIPSGHLPPPGEYRLWLPDRPPGHQPPPERW